jgi:hypothetical protein
MNGFQFRKIRVLLYKLKRKEGEGVKEKGAGKFSTSCAYEPEFHLCVASIPRNGFQFRKLTALSTIRKGRKEGEELTKKRIVLSLR